MAVLDAQFDTSAQLHRAYMPFIRHGALFFVTSKEHQLGDIVSAQYRLPNDHELYRFEGLVVWQNPLGSQGGRPPGVGLAFQTENNLHKERIEKELVGELMSDQLTSTM